MEAIFLDLKTFSQKISLECIKQQVGSLITYETTAAEQLISRGQKAEILITNKVVLSKHTLEQLPNLKLICIAATGMNNVDLNAAKTLGMTVMNVSGYSQPSVSQYVFAQMLEYFSNTSQHISNTQQGRWQTSDTFCVHGAGSQELAGKSIGIVGYGNLGQAVATIAQAFGMTVLIAERPNVSTIRPGRLSFTDVLKQADIISLHCPQIPETENLINETSLALMKPNALLINTARGAIVNSNDLLHALKKKQIAHAILDVLEQEPPSQDHPLIKALINNEATNLTLTAHIAWASIESQQRLINLIADNINTFIKSHD
jgi:glycerate dehydrogenase